MKYFFLIIMFSVSSVLSLSQASALLVTPDEYVEWAYNQQLTRYNTVEAFRYDATLSRQEAAALLVRAAEKIFEITPPSNPVCNPYRDASSFDTSLQDEIYRACTFGMMQGSRGYFFPLELLARDQTLVILMRAIDWGRKDESGSPWYKAYADRARELGISFSGVMEKPITRGELIEWIYTVYIKLLETSYTTPLSDSEWKLVKYNTDTVSGSYILSFTRQNQLSVRFCNNIGGNYTLSGNVFVGANLFSTLMYCIESESMKLETAFDLRGGSYTLSWDSLSLRTASGNIYSWKKIYSGTQVSLSGTSWKLAQWNRTSVSGSYILSFDGSTGLSVKFCNALQWQYSLLYNTFQTANLSSTKMYCDGESMPLETGFVLEGATYSIVGNTLTLTTKTGDIYQWLAYVP